MTTNAILLIYQGKLAALQTAAIQLRSGQLTALILLCIGVAAIGVLAFLCLAKQTLSLPYAFVPTPWIIACARDYKKRGTCLLKTLRLETIYQRGIERLEGTWPGSGVTGEKFLQLEHQYAKDLNIFGKGSLFELLCTCRSEVGRQRLADYLLDTPYLEETARRQEAVRELIDRQELREQVALIGDNSFQETDSTTILGWLDSPGTKVSLPFRLLALLASASLAILLLLCFDAFFTWNSVAPWILGMLLVNGLLALPYRSRILASLNATRAVGLDLKVLRSGLALLQAQAFTSPLLTELVNASAEQNAPRALRRLGRLINALDERDKPWFYALSRPLLVGTQLYLAIESWRTQNKESMQRWLSAWGDFEALTALAGYAYEHPENRFPEFANLNVIFQCKKVGHPLLSSGVCVRNDIQLARAPGENRFYVISGSNMAGKSTLLRAIGLNAVLAYTGAPVCADRMVLSRLSICASIAVQDSLLTGKSKFLAEIDRLKLALNIPAVRGPVLFLIDEILSGTNSQDRRTAAEPILRALIERGAIGALSTHDLALTELADLAGLQGSNVHMGSQDDADPLNFDYLLKPGVTTQSSALAIARLAGVAV